MEGVKESAVACLIQKTLSLSLSFSKKKKEKKE